MKPMAFARLCLLTVACASSTAWAQSYTDYMIKAKFVDGLLVADNIKLAVVEYFFSHEQKWPSSLREAGLIDPLPDLPKTVQTVSLEQGGVITVTFRSDVPELGGKKITVTPTATNDRGVTWACSAPDLALEFRIP